MDTDNMYRRNATAEESPYYAYPSSSTHPPAERTRRYSPVPTYRPRSNERLPPNPPLHAPNLTRRATDLEAHPYSRPMQSEGGYGSRYGYSSHNPTHTMPNVELPVLKSAKTRRREAWQIDILEAFYQHKHMPDKAEKEMLAARINDTLKYVNIWFQNRRQAAQKKGELRPRETLGEWRNKRHGNDPGYEEYPSPPEYATTASTSYFSQSYPPHPTMLATPNESDERRFPPTGNALALHAPATTSPFAFRLALPPPQSVPARYPEYDAQPYERAAYTPPYTSKGLAQPAGYFADRPSLERSVSMRREAPAYGFDIPPTSMERTLPALPPLEPPNSSTTASSALPSPRKESSGSDDNSIASKEKSPPSDLKLPPITSIGLPDHMSWSSTLRGRRP